MTDKTTPNINGRRSIPDFVAVWCLAAWAKMGIYCYRTPPVVNNMDLLGIGVNYLHRRTGGEKAS